MTPAVATLKFLTDHDLADESKKVELESLITQCCATSVRRTLGVDSDRLSLQELLKEITASRPDDNIAPGVQLAYLQDKELYYAAIHTFPMGTVDSRTVVAKATGPDLVTAMVNCLIKFRSI